MANPFCSYTGFGESVASFLCNASSGNLSQAQVNQIKSDAAAGIRQASAGREPSVVDNLIAQGSAEIDKVIATFSMPGEAGTAVGAGPSQSNLRIGSTNDALQFIKSAVTSANWIFWGALAIVGVVLILPYAAPSVRRAVGAVR